MDTDNTTGEQETHTALFFAADGVPGSGPPRAMGRAHTGYLGSTQGQTHTHTAMQASCTSPSIGGPPATNTHTHTQAGLFLYIVRTWGHTFGISNKSKVKYSCPL